MGHRSIVLLIGALLALSASNVVALGLGKITLESALNQPLRAEIELFEVRELTEEEIRVSIASREDFERIGIDKVFFLSDLKFKVELEEPGSPFITVTSTKLVREPFLNFVVQVQWPSGKLLREYTLLMDLPAFSQETAPAVQPSSASAAPPSREQPPAPVTSNYNPRSVYEGAPPRPTAAPVTPTYTEDTYRVRANDTLWEIAAGVRPDGSVSIHQTMLAIQRQNPDAFIRNNINLLKEGQILRIPEREEMQAMGQREAVREVAVQNAAWSGDVEVADAQLSGSSVYDDYGDDPGAREGRVKLTAPDDTFGSAEGRTSGGLADSSTEALENELAITLEQLDKSNRENSDLRSKVESLEEQIDTMERMLEVSNENLRALELSARRASEQEAAVEPEVAALDEGTVDAELAEALASDTDPGAEFLEEAPVEDSALDAESFEADDASLGAGETTSQAQQLEQGLDDEFVDDDTSGADADLAEATPRPQVDPRRVVQSTAPPEKGIVDIILENVFYIVGGIIVLVGGALFFLRRKSSEEEDFDDFIRQHGLEEEPSEPETHEIAPEDDIDLAELSGDVDGSLVEEVPAEESDLETASEAQTEDVVAEADIYIAYGKFDQAEEMLLKALAKDGGDEDVRLKLLEVYSTQGDAENFDPHYAKLRAFASPAAIERAEILRSNIPNVAEFDQASFDTSDVTSYAADAGSGGTNAAVSESMDREDAGELALDLDLGDLDPAGAESDFELELPDQAEAVGAGLETDGDVGGELDLDFDLDLPEGEDETSFDLELDLPVEDGDAVRQGSTQASSADREVDFDLEGSTGDELSTQLNIDVDSSRNVGKDTDFDIGDLDLESDTEMAGGSLEADLAALDSDLDLSTDAAGDELALGGDPTAVSSDTVVNQALNDEYIEQKLSAETDGDLSLDDALPLEADEPGQTQTLDALDIGDEDDLDLSSLDQELDALTSGLGDMQNGQQGAATTAALEEPMTDFDDFEDDLEKNEALAETVKSDHVLDNNIEEMGEDTMFDHAIKEVPEADAAGGEFELPDVNPEDVGDDDLDFLSDSDETATKLDLARAYIDMGDQEGARDIIREIMGEGNDQQKEEAEGLLARINA